MANYWIQRIYSILSTTKAQRILWISSITEFFIAIFRSKQQFKVSGRERHQSPQLYLQRRLHQFVHDGDERCLISRSFCNSLHILSCIFATYSLQMRINAFILRRRHNTTVQLQHELKIVHLRRNFLDKTTLGGIYWIRTCSKFFKRFVENQKE